MPSHGGERADTFREGQICSAIGLKETAPVYMQGGGRGWIIRLLEAPNVFMLRLTF